MDWRQALVIIKLLWDVIKFSWGLISRQIGYITDFDGNLDALKRVTDELKSMRDEIQTEVDCAEACGKNAKSIVQIWLRAADSYIDQVESIVGTSSVVEAGRSSAGRSTEAEAGTSSEGRSSVVEAGRSTEAEAGTSSEGRSSVVEAGTSSAGRSTEAEAGRNLISRWNLGKRIASLRKEIEEHINKATLGEVARSPRRSQRPDSGDVPREFEEQSSRKEAVEKILRWLKKKEVGVICVWGMGGVGKTTLVKQIRNKLEGTKDVQKVIWVAVSKYPETNENQREELLEAIQTRVAKQLELKFEKNELAEDKQERLHNRLNNVRYMLILDDLWQKLSLEELEQIGIPRPNIKNGCKIVITTRILEVSNEMKADRETKIQPLGSKEAWDLFCSNIGNVITSPGIKRVAENVLKECGGLPLAIITVGRAMRHTVEEELWEHALRTLERAAPEIPGMEENVFSALKLSYDWLKNPQVQSCFLFCALFPEDFQIEVNTLVRFWVFGEGLVKDEKTLKEALNKGHVIIKKLTDACLLERETSWWGYDYVGMHDLVRDLAIRITSTSVGAAATITAAAAAAAPC